jgi:phosphodiesterase/alkaline phosphatase D-like protein
MRRAVACALFAAALAAAGGAKAAGFALGVAAGEVTSSSAVLWTRAPSAGPVVAELSADARFRRGVVRRTYRVTRATDLTLRVTVRRLRPGTRYAYRFRAGRAVSAVGRFTTASGPSSTAPVEFAYSGDADATPDPRTGAPAFNQFAVYARMAAEGNAFNVNLGDTIYSDSGVGGAAPALTIPQKWAKYRQNLALPALRRLRASTGLYSHWDDHEFINDFSRPEHGDALYRAGVEAFADYAPVAYSATEGLYRSVRWGRNLELFFLDERSFRDAKASAGGTCDNPATPGRPDLAPTAPVAVRAAFAALVPSLAQPVAPACLARIGDPSRTMLGERQYNRFTTAVQTSTATFKVVLNEVPIQQFYALPYDRWEGYEAERTRLLDALTDVRNVVFLTTDTHANFVGEVRLRTFEPPGPVGTGMLEAITGPVATNTFAREIDATLGAPGTGSLLNALFFKPAPPRGIGMRCAASDVFSYAQVRVTATELTITPKDQNGQLVRELGGNPCGPFTIAAR